VREDGSFYFSKGVRFWQDDSRIVQLLTLRYDVGLALFSAICVLVMKQLEVPCEAQLFVAGVRGLEARFWTESDLRYMPKPKRYSFSDRSEPEPFRFTLPYPNLLVSSIRAYANFWQQIMMEIEFHYEKEEEIWDAIAPTVPRVLHDIGMDIEEAKSAFNLARDKGTLAKLRAE
jgi:hypothetical protein